MRATFYAHRDRIRTVQIETYESMKNSFAFHSTVELVLIYEGKVKAWIGEMETTLVPGDVAVVLSNEAHQFRSSEEGKSVSVYIPTFLCADFVDIIGHKTVLYPVIREAQATKRIFDAVEIMKQEPLNEIEQKGYIHVILGTVLRHIEPKDIPETKENTLPSKLLFYINEHYREDLSTQSIAQALGYSSHYLSETFRACFHVSINSYINTVRLKRAIVLLRDKSKSVIECAMESGFSSLRTFYRVFTSEFGCTPREYRKPY